MAADPGEAYVRAAVLSADAAMAMVLRLTSGQEGPVLLHADAVTIAAAAVPTIAGEILKDPEVMEPEQEPGEGER